MRARILIFSAFVLILFAGTVNGFGSFLTCTGSSLQALASCVNSNLSATQGQLSTFANQQSRLQTQVNTLNSRLTALATTVSTLQPSTLTTANLVGTYTMVQIGTVLQAAGNGGTSGGVGINYETVQGTLVLNQDLSFVLTQNKTESQLMFSTHGGGQANNGNLNVSLQPQVLTDVTGTVTNTLLSKAPSGTWSLVGNTLTLTATSGNGISFTVANSGHVLLTFGDAGDLWLAFQSQ